ncbi:MAG: formate/nitrite transporter family protein [Muribaculaceae bacterium]|nr:formate/nitrite transporter family protein [Muribaculaceae bacterium]
MKKVIVDSILAGFCISLGGIVNLKVGGIAGAVLFSFGLITVISYRLKLYTGVSGFVRTRRDFIELPVVIIGNVVGCLFAGLATKYALPDLVATAQGLVDARLSKSLWQVLLLAAACGFIMTTVVKFAREGKWLPLLFGIPLFILSGFIHSIADAYYLSAALTFDTLTWSVVALYIMELLGNFIGCNLYRGMQKFA